MCPIDSDLKERTVMQRLILGMVEIHGNSEMMWFRPIFKDQIKHQKKTGCMCPRSFTWDPPDPLVPLNQKATGERNHPAGQLWGSKLSKQVLI